MSKKYYFICDLKSKCSTNIGHADLALTNNIKHLLFSPVLRKYEKKKSNKLKYIYFICDFVTKDQRSQ